MSFLKCCSGGNGNPDLLKESIGGFAQGGMVHERSGSHKMAFLEQYMDTYADQNLGLLNWGMNSTEMRFVLQKTVYPIICKEPCDTVKLMVASNASLGVQVIGALGESKRHPWAIGKLLICAPHSREHSRSRSSASLISFIAFCQLAPDKMGKLLDLQKKAGEGSRLAP